MRFSCLIWLFAQIALISACNRQAGQSGGVEGDRINLSQNVTTAGRPVDVAFKDFEKNWRRFISTSPEVAAPVVGTIKREPSVPEPVIFSECVFSPDAKGYVPQVTISWNEPAAPVAEIRGKAPQAAPGEAARMRFDLGVHYNAFSRNYYSAILSTNKLQRFSLPSNSALVSNPEAVVLTGPGLFPKLMEFTTQTVQDSKANRRLEKQTMVLRDLNQGISYSMRVSRPAGNQWTADRQMVFMSPVCPTSF